MSDFMDELDNDQSFWEEVDALRSMLEEEESSESLPVFSGPARNSREAAAYAAEKDRRAPVRAERPAPYAAPQSPSPKTSACPRNPVPRPAQDHRPAGRPDSYVPPVYPGYERAKCRSPRAPGRGLLIFLYILIFLELAAISVLGYGIYAWIH